MQTSLLLWHGEPMTAPSLMRWGERLLQLAGLTRECYNGASIVDIELSILMGRPMVDLCRLEEALISEGASPEASLEEILQERCQPETWTELLDMLAIER